MGVVFGDEVTLKNTKKSRTAAKKEPLRKGSDDVTEVSPKLNRFMIATIHSVLLKILGVRSRVLSPLIFDKF